MDSNLKTSTDRLNAANRRKMSTESNVFATSIVSPELMITHCVNSTQDLSTLDPKVRKKSFRRAIPEIIFSCCATSFHVIVGVTFAATATLLPRLMEEGSDIKPTQGEAALIASIFVIIVPVASLFSGLIMERFGRLCTIKLSIIPSVASCVLIALATNVEMIIAGRLLMGIGAALGTSPAVVYITEIASPEYRGSLVSAGPTLSSFGMLVGYLSGAFLDWRLVSWINVAYCVIPIVLIYLMRIPESPVWLMSKNREKEAKESLERLAQKEDRCDQVRLVEKGLRAMREDIEKKKFKTEGMDGTGSEKKPSFWNQLRGFTKPTGYRPLIVMVILFAFQQYTGVYITTFYAVQFFESSGSSMDKFHAAILIGLTRFIMSMVTVYLLKKFGKRPLCFISCIGMAVCMTVSGYYTRVANETKESSMVPVYSIILYVAFSMPGLLSLPWTMAAEVFPTEIRAIGHGTVIASAHIIMFISLQLYFDMATFLGGHDIVQWFFAVISVIALVYVYFFLPETRKMLLTDIEEHFDNHWFYEKPQTKTYLAANADFEIRTEPSKPTDRKFSVRAPLETLAENLNEYETLIRQNDEKRPSIVRKDDSGNNNIGNYDLSEVPYIDKSTVELDRIS